MGLVNIREEMEAIKNRLIQLPNLQMQDTREVINFQAYMRNPMEFLEPVQENLIQNRETRWHVIRNMLD